MTDWDKFRTIFPKLSQNSNAQNCNFRALSKLGYKACMIRKHTISGNETYTRLFESKLNIKSNLQMWRFYSFLWIIGNYSSDVHIGNNYPSNYDCALWEIKTKTCQNSLNSAKFWNVKLWDNSDCFMSLSRLPGFLYWLDSKCNQSDTG